MSNMVNESVVRGAFHTDGKTFVFTMADVPLSGVGATPQAAFDDLMAAYARAGDLPARLEAMSREQAGAADRRAIIKLIGIGMIALTVIGGALGGAVALAPRVVADVAQTTLEKVNEWASELTPEERRNLRDILNEPPEDAAPANETEQ
jgi:hypothetical protein